MTEPPSVSATADPNRFSFVLRMRLRTLQDIPVTIPVVGDCAISVDTAPGILPYVEVRGEIGFGPVPSDPDNPWPVALSAVVVDNLGADDVALTGGFGCQLATFGVGAMVGILRNAIEDSFRDGLWSGLCHP